MPIDPLQEIKQIQTKDRYDKLPRALQGVYTREQFLWLSAGEKDRLVEMETNPEWIELT